MCAGVTEENKVSVLSPRVLMAGVTTCFAPGRGKNTLVGLFLSIPGKCLSKHEKIAYRKPWRCSRGARETKPVTGEPREQR